MPESTRLYRSHNYPYQNISEDVERERFLETKSGIYILTMEEEGIGFTLTLPSGKKVNDSFAEFSERYPLYKLLDEGESAIYIETEYIKGDAAEEQVEMTMNSDKYILTVNKKTEACKLELPAQVREFSIDNVFLDNPDLPLLFEGRLIIYFRDMLKKKGITLPPTPYFPGIKITQQ